ncbi:MAG: hypothetical protein JRG71_01780 [Deltaproteobacteria bacterium]|nr:hypothetical protein [Deltaproteobacteria bacterium]
MPSFSALMTDTVTLLKQDGTDIDQIKASVQKNKIFIFNSDFIVESGDLIQRKMSNGAEETYEVIDPGFHGKFHGIEAHYQMDVRKLGRPEAQKAVQSITYHITGPNARINQNSVDNSVNVVSINPQVAEHLEAMRVEVERLITDQNEKKEAKELLTAIEGQFELARPSKAVVSTLLKSLPSVGSLAALGSFLLSCIA